VSLSAQEEELQEEKIKNQLLTKFLKEKKKLKF